MKPQQLEYLLKNGLDADHFDYDKEDYPEIHKSLYVQCILLIQNKYIILFCYKLQKILQKLIYEYNLLKRYNLYKCFICSRSIYI